MATTAEMAKLGVGRGLDMNPPPFPVSGLSPYRSSYRRGPLPEHRLHLSPPADSRRGGRSARSASCRERADGDHLSPLLVTPGLSRRGADRKRRQPWRPYREHRADLRQAPSRSDERRHGLAERRRRLHVRQPAVSRARPREQGARDVRPPPDTRGTQTEKPDRSAVETRVCPASSGVVASVRSHLAQAQCTSGADSRPPHEVA